MSVYDPKARVLGVHAGSVGLFRPLEIWKFWVTIYRSFAEILPELCFRRRKTRSLAWIWRDCWTIGTGTFLLYNRKSNCMLFLSTDPRDERPMDPRSNGTLMELTKENGDRGKILPKTEKEAWFSHRFFFFFLYVGRREDCIYDL